ncbi:MAG: Ion transport 2 domain protein [Chitinophagaceae bacterium]|nr:Ion transport 2 domain protein [Chitinophagaceae bacterium]
MKKVILYLQRHKYEILLLALIQHLFIGIFLQDMNFYTEIIWPVNMLILGISSVGVYVETSPWRSNIKNALFFCVLLLPLGLPFIGKIPHFMSIHSLAYFFFFAFIFYEVMKFLIKPSYINVDIISASACGYFLLIESGVFLLQFLFYYDSTSFKGIDVANHATVFMDLIYFCSITITSIGFGDITPTAHYMKLITAFFGISGQFYAVVLMGILIGKFSAQTKRQD